MKANAKCKFDFDSIKAVTLLSIYKKSNPKKTVQIRTILCLALILIIVTELIAFGFDFVPIILIVADLLVIVFDLFMYFVLPRIRYKSLAKIKDLENCYLFSDDAVKIFSKSKEYNGEAEIEYSLFIKVYETSKYFFLYQTNNQVLLVDKLTIEGGSVDEIRNKLSSFVKDKYFICKY